MVTETSGITTFVSDAESVWSRPDYIPQIPRSAVKQAIVSRQDIHDYLARPIVVATGSYGVTTVAQTILQNISITANINDTMWYNKWRGNLLFRGTAVFRLTINAMPFQAGLLMLKALPGSQEANSIAVRTKSVTQISQLPGIIFSLRQTEAELRVPYRAPTDFYELTSGVLWGRVILYAYTAMRTAATSAPSCDYTLWQSWDDVELEVPTLPQSEGVGRKTRRNVKMLKGRSTESEKNEGRGPLTLILGGGAKIAQGLSSIPFINPLMVSAQWFLNAAEGVASSFGWSKPVNSSTPHRVMIATHAYGINSDGEDMSLPLAMTVDSSVVPIDTMGYTNMDEMSFAYLKTRWSYAYNALATWPTILTNGDSIWVGSIHPTMGDRDVSDATSSGVIVYTHTTPIGFLSRLFQLWRGSIKIRFRFAKTEYHSGRLQFVYSPGTNSSFGNEQEWCLREVIDLREGDEFCFTLPYARAQTWLDVGEAMGHAQLRIVNPLRAASTVDTTIDFVVEISGGDDLEFAIPRSTSMAPYLPQMDTGGDADRLLACEPVGGAYPESMDSGSQYTIGEQIQSLKQLALRFTRIFFVATAGGIPSAASGTLRPFYLGGIASSAPLLPHTQGAFCGDYVSLICSLYAFNRGSIRFRTVQDPSSSTTIVGLRSPANVTEGSGSNSNMGQGGTFVGNSVYLTGSSLLFAHAVFSAPMNQGWTVHVPVY